MSWAKAELKPVHKGSIVVALVRFCYIQIMFVARCILFLVMGLSPFHSVAQGATEEQLNYVMCRDKKVVRTIRVTKKGDECTTVYTKAGVDKVVSSGKNRQSCIGVLENIKGNLEEAAWKCKDISSASVSGGN